MDLNSIIPKTGEWKVSKNRAFRYNVAWLPVFDIISDTEINIFLDLRNSRDILKVVKTFKKQNINFILYHLYLQIQVKIQESIMKLILKTI
jgi:hypothetical protein